MIHNECKSITHASPVFLYTAVPFYRAYFSTALGSLQTSLDTILRYLRHISLSERNPAAFISIF